MNLIVAVDNNWAIGNKNKLLVSIPNDMKHFREETSDGASFLFPLCVLLCFIWPF